MIQMLKLRFTWYDNLNNWWQIHSETPIFTKALPFFHQLTDEVISSHSILLEQDLSDPITANLSTMESLGDTSASYRKLTKWIDFGKERSNLNVLSKYVKFHCIFITHDLARWGLLILAEFLILAFHWSLRRNAFNSMIVELIKGSSGNAGPPIILNVRGCGLVWLLP